MESVRQNLFNDYAAAVLEVAAGIPAGTVLSYGDIAELLEAGGPRQVGSVMARFGQDVPWWRVVRASGLPPQGHAARARPHYHSEGTPLRRTSADTRSDDGGAYRVDMRAARWHPADDARRHLREIVDSLGHRGNGEEMSEPHDGLRT